MTGKVILEPIPDDLMAGEPLMTLNPSDLTAVQSKLNATPHLIGSPRKKMPYKLHAVSPVGKVASRNSEPPKHKLLISPACRIFLGILLIMLVSAYSLVLCYVLPSFGKPIVTIQTSGATDHGEHILILKYSGTLKWELDDNPIPAISTQTKTSSPSMIISAINPETEHKTNLVVTFKQNSTASHLGNVQHYTPKMELQAAKQMRTRRDLFQVLRGSYEDMKSKYKTIEHQVKAKVDEIVEGTRKIRQKRNCFSTMDARRRCHNTNRKKRLLLEDNAGNVKNELRGDSDKPNSDYVNVKRTDNIKTDAQEEKFEKVSFKNDSFNNDSLKSKKSKKTAAAGEKFGYTAKIKKGEPAEREDLDVVKFTVVKEAEDSSDHEEEGGATIAAGDSGTQKLGG